LSIHNGSGKSKCEQMLKAWLKQTDFRRNKTMSDQLDKNPADKTATLIEPKDKTNSKVEDIANKAAEKSSKTEKDFDTKQQPVFSK
jgi:N-acetylglucosamine kinase-like BadF-type ATPase